MYSVTVTPRLHASSTAATIGEALNTGDWINTSFFASLSAIVNVATRGRYHVTTPRFAGCERRGGRVWLAVVDSPEPLEQVCEANVDKRERSLCQNHGKFVPPTFPRLAAD